MRTQEFIIPPTKEERHRGPTDSEIETAIHPLFDYLDVNNHTLASTLSSDEMELVMAKLWKQILVTIEGLIVPPLSDKRSHMRPLGDMELDIALSWLRFLKDFLYAGGDSSGVSSTILQNQRYHDLLSTRLYYDLSTDKLMEVRMLFEIDLLSNRLTITAQECVRGFQSTLKYRVTKPSKSLRAQRNLGTIRARKDAKQARVVNTSGNTEMIMRILRMRSVRFSYNKQSQFDVLGSQGWHARVFGPTVANNIYGKRVKSQERSIVRLVADVQSDHMATVVFNDTSSNTLPVFLDLCYLCHKLVNGGEQTVRAGFFQRLRFFQLELQIA